VFQRADGCWVAKYRDAGGRWRYVYRKSKGEARKALRQALKDRDEGVSPSSMTVVAFLDSWLEGMRDMVSLRTWLNHEGIVRLHLKPTIGPKRLARLTPKDVHRLYKGKLADGLSPGRVRKIHVTLSRALKDAVRWRDLSRNVAAEVTPPKEYRREIRVLTPQQVKQLLDATRGDRLEAAYVLPATCGLRQSECLSLRFEDIDFARRTLKIRRTVWRNQVYPPKTPRSRRILKLPQIALDALGRHARNNDGAREGWLFPTKQGNPDDAHNFIHRPWKRMFRKAGLSETTRYHDLRHGAASLLLSQNVPVPVVSNYLGHADPSITLRVYAHMIDGMDKIAATVMDDVLGDDSDTWLPNPVFAVYAEVRAGTTGILSRAPCSPRQWSTQDPRGPRS
jgi:integrase